MNKHTITDCFFLNLICTPFLLKTGRWRRLVSLRTSTFHHDKFGQDWTNNALAETIIFLKQEKFYTLPTDFFIESRWGKINSHDGMTVFILLFRLLRHSDWRLI